MTGRGESVPNSSTGESRYCYLHSLAAPSLSYSRRPALPTITTADCCLHTTSLSLQSPARIISSSHFHWQPGIPFHLSSPPRALSHGNNAQTTSTYRRLLHISYTRGHLVPVRTVASGTTVYSTCGHSLAMLQAFTISSRLSVTCTLSGDDSQL
ncbi:hypothetical protein J6590_006169 [Homalodisca vitripennis]|nr:hypothetical protein J6590_006169 [Homalodisca vitripennis]